MNAPQVQCNPVVPTTPKTPVPVNSHWLTISSNAFPTKLCALDAIQDGDEVAGLVYIFGDEAPKKFTIETLKKPTTLFTQDFQKVVQVQVENGFNKQSGGSVKIIMLHEFNTFSANDYRTIHLQIKRENGKWIALIDEGTSLVRFDSMALVSGKYGIDSMTLSYQGKQVDTNDFTKGDLK